jgi:hypothetical protein
MKRTKKKIHKGIFLRMTEHQVRSSAPVEVTVNPVDGRGGRLLIRKTSFEVLRPRQPWGKGLRLTPQEFLDKLLK